MNTFRKRPVLSQLKIINLIYFNFLFTFIFFFLSSILVNLGLGFSIILQSHIGHILHNAVTAIVIQSHSHNEI